jgi:hypothetical protein
MNNVQEISASDVTPFVMLWAEETPTSYYKEDQWFFSQNTQGFSTNITASRDKSMLTPPPPGQDGGDYTCTFG